SREGAAELRRGNGHGVGRRIRSGLAAHAVVPGSVTPCGLGIMSSFAGAILMSDKQLIIEALQKLPDDVSFEEVREELEILAALRRARQASAEDRVWSLEDAKQRAAQWTLQ